MLEPKASVALCDVATRVITKKTPSYLQAHSADEIIN